MVNSNLGPYDHGAASLPISAILTESKRASVKLQLTDFHRKPQEPEKNGKKLRAKSYESEIKMFAVN